MAREAKLLESKAVYEFDCFRVDPTNRLLLRDGEVVPLTAKTFDLLLVLVESDGRLLEKEDVLRRVWPQSFVEEGNLTRHVSTLRKALGETPKAHQFIITVPGYGYKFVAPVKELRETPSITTITEQAVSTTVIEEEISMAATPATRALSETQEKATGLKGTQKRRPKRLLMSVACLVVMALTLLLIFRREKAGLPSKEPALKSIAVLPLKPLNADNRDSVYELGIADSLILKLSSVKELMVRPLSATRKYTNLEQDPLVAGREQQVDYVLTSNYQLADGKIRVTAQLVNVQDGSVASVFKCDESCTDIFATQDAISEKVGRLLLTRLSTEQNNQLAKRYTNNEEAYRLYLQGKYFLDRPDEAKVHKAIDAFEQAIKLDPNYALAYVELAWAHRVRSFFGLDTHGEESKKAKDAVMQALALDDSLAEAHSAVGEIQDNYDWNFTEGEQSHKRALELNPNSARIHAQYGIHLMNVGRLDEAMAESKVAIELEPTSQFNNGLLGDALYWSRRYDEAIAQYKRAMSMDVSNPVYYDVISKSYAMKGDYEQALEWYYAAYRQDGANAKDLQAVKTAYTKLGWRGILQIDIEHLQQQIEKKGRSKYSYLAPLYAQLSDRERAFRCLEKAYENRESWIVTILIDPELDPLRSDPRFDDLLYRIGLKS